MTEIIDEDFNNIIENKFGHLTFDEQRNNKDFLIMQINKAQQLIDHISSFPDRTLLVPFDKNRCVEASLPNKHGIIRHDGMSKEIFLNIIKNNHIKYERTLEKLMNKGECK
jgi:hypothetical protein